MKVSPGVFAFLFPVPPGNRRNGHLAVIRRENGADPGLVVRVKESMRLGGSTLKSPDWLGKALDARSGRCVHIGPVQAVRSIKVLIVLGRFGEEIEKQLKRQLRRIEIVNNNTQLQILLGTTHKLLVNVVDIQPAGAVRFKSTGRDKTRIFFQSPDSDSTETSDATSDED